MNSTKSVVAVACLLLLMAPFLTAWTLPPAAGVASPAQQGPQDDWRQELVWNFAVLQYVNARGEMVEVPARNMSRLYVLRGAEDQIRLEILFENRDYSSVETREFHLIRSSAQVSAVDVAVVRDHFGGMAFPGFKGKD